MFSRRHAFLSQDVRVSRQMATTLASGPVREGSAERQTSGDGGGDHLVGSDWHLEHFSKDQGLGRQRSGIDFRWWGRHTLHGFLEGCSKFFPSQTGLGEWLGMCSYVQLCAAEPLQLSDASWNHGDPR